MTIGSSHHFLFSARNDQNSAHQAFALGFRSGHSNSNSSRCLVTSSRSSSLPPMVKMTLGR